MKNFKLIILILLFFLMFQTSSEAAFRAKNDNNDISSIGNKIIEEEYPQSENVEPRTDTDIKVIKAGIEEVMDVSLDDCIRYALGNNPRIQAAMQDVYASDARIKQAWSAYFTQFSWQTGYTRIKQLQLSDVLGRDLIFNYYMLGQISASQLLYDFGVTQNRVTIRKLDSQGYKITLTKTVNDVVCEVKKAYYNLQYALQAQKVAQDMVEKYEAFYNQAKAYYKAGTAPKVDVTIAEVNLSNSKLNLIQADNAVEIAMAKLSNTMGLSYESRYKINDNLQYPACEITLTESIEIAKASRPEFQLADVKVEEAKQNVKLVKKSYFPTLTVEGQFQVGGKTFVSNTGYNFGGYLNFPTINGMLIKNEIKEAKFLQTKEQANAQNTKNNIYYEVQQSYYTLNEMKNSVPVAFLGLKKAKENYELSYGRYKVGVGNPVELKDAQTQYQDAMLKYYKTLALYNAAKADLEKNIGKNLSSDDVKPDVDTKSKKKKS